MKKKLFLFLSAILCITSIFYNSIPVQAEEGEEIPWEALLTEDTLVGYAPLVVRGVYLASGNSRINDAGGGKIGVGGVTTAARECKVSVNVIVERYDNGWERVTSYTDTRQNALIAVVSRSLAVGSGYYYRVRCLHHASTDASSSYTNSLWM